MSKVTLAIPTEVMKAARSKLGGGGQERVKEYLLCSLHCLAHDGQSLSPQTVRELLRGLKTPSIRPSEDYWNKKIQRYKRRNRTSLRRA